MHTLRQASILFIIPINVEVECFMNLECLYTTALLKLNLHCQHRPQGHSFTVHTGIGKVVVSWTD